MKNPALRFGTFLVIVASLLGLGFAGKMIYLELLRSNSPARLLPADTTALYLELDLSDSHQKDFDKLFAKYPSWQLTSWREQLSELLFAPDSLSALPEDLALALTSEGEPLLFASDLPDSFLDQLTPALQVQKEGDIYVSPLQSLAWTEAKGYTIFARAAAPLQALLDSDAPDLESDSDFISVRSSLPQLPFLFAYFQGSALLSESDSQTDLWQPLAALIDRGGLTLELDSEGFLARTQTIFSETLCATASRIFSRLQSSSSDLADYFPSDTLAFYESADLRTDWQDLQALLQDSSPVLSELFSAQQDYWEQGTGLSLEDDILALADGSYALAVLPPSSETQSQSGQIALPEFALLLENETQFLTDKLSYLSDIFTNKLPAMYPEESDIQLPDGTTAPALMLASEAERREFAIGDFQVTSLTFPELPFDLAYTIADGHLYLASSEDALLRILTADSSLADNPLFQTGQSKINGMRTDFSFFDLPALVVYFPDFTPYFEPFAALTSGKNLLDFESLTASFLQVK